MTIVCVKWLLNDDDGSSSKFKYICIAWKMANNFIYQMNQRINGTFSQKRNAHGVHDHIFCNFFFQNKIQQPKMDFNLVVIYSMLLFGYVENILKANCVCNDLCARFLLIFTFSWILKYHAMFMLIFYSAEINVFRFASWWVLQTWEHRRVESMNETHNHQWESKRYTNMRMYKRQTQGERER